jgi:hypothetical protein
MNGRLYDPLLARMLSPDNYVQAAGNTQSYNRYSYVWNNPLKFTDPDGQWVHLVVGAVIGGVVNWAAHGAEFSWKGLGYFGVGAAAGALSAGIGAGVNVAMAGGSFGAGFMGTATGVASTGVLSGAATGASAGFANGFVSGTGNALLGNNNIGQSLTSGLVSGAKQGVAGGITGGIFGGIDAYRKDLNIFSGKANMDLSNGFGAHGNIVGDETVTGKYVGQYKHDKTVSVYEADIDGGITLPGRGIVVGKGVYSKNLDPSLMQHEYGHILQAREFGNPMFYSKIGPSSLSSATRSRIDPSYHHRTHWTEVMANRMSYNYFNQPSNWDTRFPLNYLNYDWIPFFIGLSPF